MSAFDERPKLRVHRKKDKRPNRKQTGEDIINPHGPTMPGPRTVFEGGIPRTGGVYNVEVAKVEFKDGRLVQTMRRVRTPADPVLSWDHQRRVWNAEGFCSRAACGQPGRPQLHDSRRHPESDLLYCDCCADMIEEANTDMGLRLPRDRED